MRVVITGGAGFLGSRLCAALLARGELSDSAGRVREISQIVRVDIAAAAEHPDPRVVMRVGDLAAAGFAASAVAADTDSVFHLAAVVSGQAEAEFDVGMRVNLDATRALLEQCRRCATPPKVVFASSLAVFGGSLPDPVPDDAPLMPQSSYGTQKAIGELLVSDMSRKDFVDGRALRLPTIVVRPGKPNRAASSFASGIIREPLSGVEATCPVAPRTRMWLQSPGAVIDNLIVGHEAPASAFGTTRSVNVPGITVSVADMVAALRTVGGEAAAARVRWSLDPVIDRIVSSWPAAFNAARGHSLGMRADADFTRIVQAYASEQAVRPG